MTPSLLPIEQSTDLVTFTIEVNGEPLPAHYPVLSIEVIKEANRVPYASLRFSDGDASTGEWELSSEDYFVPGNEITILAGYHSEDEPIFSGIVISQSLRVRSSRLELQIVCKDKFVALTTTKKSRHFVDTTDSDAVSQILGDYDVTAGEITTTSVTHGDLVQFDSCDWDFIVMRMEANGLVCLLTDEGFHAVPPSLNGEPVATIEFGNNVIEFDAKIDARNQLSLVTSQSWDPAAQDYAEAESEEPSWETNGNLDPDEIAAAVGGDNQSFKHGGAVTADEIQQWSNAALLKSRASFVRGRVRVKGFHQVQPGSVIELAGFGERFNGLVWVKGVRHEIGQGNWTVDIEFGLDKEWHAEKYQTSALPANGMLAAVSGLHAGIVTALEGDPLSESRIRIKIPSINLDGEGVWARVSVFDAGSSRGAYFMPEIDDEVLVGFLNDDPRHPVVVGMLYSSAHASPEEHSDDNHIRGYYSRSGIKIRFDDDAVKLEIETPGGHKFVLDDDAGEASLTDSNSNKIVLSSSGITLESASDLNLKASGNITVEGQTNLELKAGAQWKCEGSAGVEVNSSAVTIIKGSLVQIN